MRPSTSKRQVPNLVFLTSVDFHRKSGRAWNGASRSLVVRETGDPADLESAMMRVLISVLLGAVIQPALACELQQPKGVHSVVVDIPHLIDITYASPDTWHNVLPKVELYEQLPVTILGSNRGQLPTSPRLPTYLAAVQLQ
jgi:hypothetical protein